MLTCKLFLAELTDYLDEKLDSILRLNLEKHMSECPDCWVVCDTTRKTLAVYKGHEKQCCIPHDVQNRLLAAVERKIADKRKSQASD